MPMPTLYIMKKYFYLSFIFLGFALFTACNTTDDAVDNTKPEASYFKIQEITYQDFLLELYSSKRNFESGSNDLMVKLTQHSKPIMIPLLDVSLTMHMSSSGHNMSHGAPTVPLKSKQQDGYYEGYIIPTMPSFENQDYWSIRITTRYNGDELIFEDRIVVQQAQDKNLVTFNNLDTQYILALAAPTMPKIGLNKAALWFFKTENHTDFEIVNEHKIVLDPRMPTMQNHGSPNNIDLTQPLPLGWYTGQLSFSMTGLWRINLIVLDAQENSMGGNAVTEEQQSSSLYFEVQF